MSPYRLLGRPLSEAPRASRWRRFVYWLMGKPVWPACGHCGQRFRTRAEWRARRHLPRELHSFAKVADATFVFAVLLAMAIFAAVCHSRVTVVKGSPRGQVSSGDAGTCLVSMGAGEQPAWRPCVEPADKESE